MKRPAAASTISGIIIIIIGILAVIAITFYFYSGVYYVSQTGEIQRLLTYRDQEYLAVSQGSSFIKLTDEWDHTTRLTYVLILSPNGSVSVQPLDVIIAPGQSWSYPYESGCAYAFLTSYGNEFWASNVSNPALERLTLTISENAPLGTTSPPVGTYVYPFGSKVLISATPSPGYYFAGWKGSGYGSYTGSSPSGTAYMWSNITEEALFGVKITFYADGLSGLSPSADVLEVNGTYYPYSSFPVVLYVPYGYEINYAFVSPINSGPGERYVLQSVSGLSTAQSATITVTQSGYINASYQLQYYLNMYVDPLGAGAVYPGSGWYSPGSQVQIGATANKGWVFANWTGTGTVSYTGTKNPATIVMDSPITEVAYFLKEYNVTFNETGLDSSAQGTVLTVNGTSYTYSQLPVTITVVSGQTLTYSWASPVSGGNGIRFIWISTSGLDTAQSGSFKVTQSGYVTGNYQKQYYLNMSVSPSGAGTVSPGSGWYSAGSTVQISESPNPGYAFVGWTGNGTGSYTGPSTSATITMNSPITEVANYVKYVTLTFSATGLNSSATGVILKVTYEGTTYSLSYSSLPFTLNVIPGSTVSYSFSSPVNPSSGYYRWIWVSTSGLATAQSGTITVAQGGNITGNYELEYEYVFVEHYLPSGATWSITANGQTYSEPAGTNIVIWATSSSLPFTASNVTYNGQTYVPTPQSGTATPGITNIYYQIPVSGVVGLIFVFPPIIAVIRDFLIQLLRSIPV
ncbi:MAG: InlB B-repeat-containing protein [Nitrososphaeria archaeon]